MMSGSLAGDIGLIGSLVKEDIEVGVRDLGFRV